VVAVAAASWNTVFSEPGTTVSVVGSTVPNCNSVSAATGSGKPKASWAGGDPVNQVMTTLVSVTVTTSRSRTSSSPPAAVASPAVVAAPAASVSAVPPVASAPAVAASPAQSNACRRLGPQQFMGASVAEPD
jgi:hypothetical protein